MARGKVHLKKIQNPVNRRVTFSKRKGGLLKKAKELSLLCDAEVGLIIFSPTGKMYESAKPSMNRIMEKYQKNYSPTKGKLKLPDNMEVQATMVIERDKMRRFLRDGHATFYYYELKHGYQWRRTLDDFRIFELVCNQLNKEVRDKGNSKKEELAMLMQIQEHKSIVWMEGPLGWTAWVNIHHDVLS